MAGVWTNNWTAMKNALLCGDYIEDLSALRLENGNLYKTLTSSANSHGNPYLHSALGVMAVNGQYVDNMWITLGSGDTAPAPTDYAVERPLSGISYLSVINEKPTWNTSTGVVSNVIKLTVQNTNASAVTVKEWGVFVQPGNTGKFMIYRGLLDSPVTLNATQSATLTLTRSVTLTDPVVWPSI